MSRISTRSFFPGPVGSLRISSAFSRIFMLLRLLASDCGLLLPRTLRPKDREPLFKPFKCQRCKPNMTTPPPPAWYARCIQLNGIGPRMKRHFAGLLLVGCMVPFSRELSAENSIWQETLPRIRQCPFCIFLSISQIRYLYKIDGCINLRPSWCQLDTTPVSD